MLLKRITLSNIRSYRHQTIELAEGSTLLAGDIGCGKSSLLLALEFALFGASRPDLPAEALLRKGEMQGSVELSFSLLDQEVSIKRNLKKDHHSIKQASGHIIINGIKKELTAVELKAEIISLLGYPEELIDKNKNYIFRFTVYTPQEEMKLILQEAPEQRLEVIRKIFNLEKYCQVRENVLHALKQMRVSLGLMKVRLENLDEKKKSLRQLTLELEELQRKHQELQPPLQAILGQLSVTNKKIEQLETVQRERQQLLLEKAKVGALIEEKRQFLALLSERRNSLLSQLESLRMPENVVEEMISSEIARLEEREKVRVAAISTWQERLVNLRQLIPSLQLEVQSGEQKLSLKLGLNDKVLGLGELSKKQPLLAEQQRQLEQSLESLQVLIIQNSTIIDSSGKIKAKIINLDRCPTCLQEVSSEHKQHINLQQDQIINEAEAVLRQLEPQKNSLVQQLNLLKQNLIELQGLEQLKIKLQSELRQLEELEVLCVKKKEQLKQLIKENNASIKGLQAASQEPSLRQQISQLQEIKLKYSKQKMLEKNRVEVEGQLAALQQLIHSNELKLASISAALEAKTNPQDEIVRERNKHSLLKDQEKESSLAMIELKTNANNALKNKQQLERELASLQAVELERNRLQETYHWLESYFIPLTASIERQVMTKIYSLFNEMFQDWFAILINNEQISARLDDSFTPIIDQNGYEIFFSNLSGGEKTAVSLAYRLSLTKVINDVISRIKTKNILILDEPTDGFSSEQLDRVRDVLERLQLRQTIMVSHESKIESFVENVIRISKEGH